MTAAAAFVAGLSAWLSQGSMAFDGSASARLAILPISVLALILAVLAAAAVVAMRRAGASLTPVALLALPMLPWLPVPVPTVFLLWSGPIVLAVWAAAAWGMTRSVGWRLPAMPLRPALRAGLLAMAVYSLAAWGVSPAVPGGDEPHYLIITQSLLLDHDLKIENNHQRGDYHAYFAGDLSKPDYYRRGRDGQIYSVHAPGVSALVAPAFAIGGYRGVVLFLLVISSAAAALAWELARRITGRTDAAWFGWAALVLSPVTLLNASTVYPDGPGALIVLTGVWALVRAREERVSGAHSAWPWFVHGAALALLPWLHTRFVLLAGCLGALVMLDLARTRNPAGKASAFLAVPAVSALAWIGFFIAVYGAPDPAIPYRGSDLGSPAYIMGGLGGLFFDQMYGLFVNAPVLVAALGGLIGLGRRPGPFRLLPLELLFLIVPYALTVTHFAMWWGGFSSPARFLVPLLPTFSLLVAAAWAASERRGTRTVLSLALLLTTLMSIMLVLVDRGRIAYFLRDNVYALWIEWANRTIDLEHALPAFFARVQRGRAGGLFFGEIAVWCGAAVAAWLAVRSAGDRSWCRARGRLETLGAVALAVAAMVASTVVWRLEGVNGQDAASASMNMLRHAAASGRTMALDVSGMDRLSTDALARRLEVRLTPRPRRPGVARDDRGLFALPLVPAGDYRIHVEPGQIPGWLMIGIGRDQFAIVTRQLQDASGDIVVRLPVDVRGIVVRADEDASARLRQLVVQPLSIVPADQKLSALTARRAVRYGATTAFFVDEQSFPEPAGFWVGGARSSQVVLQPDAPRRAIALQLRNAPIDNLVTVRSGAWHDELRLAAGEERRVEVPVDPARNAALVTFEVSAGFRPSAADPASRDPRLLGAWVKVE